MAQALIDPVDRLFEKIPGFDDHFVHRAEVVADHRDALRRDQVLLLQLLQVMPGKALHLQHVRLVQRLVFAGLTAHCMRQALEETSFRLVRQALLAGRDEP
ncbi:hypothetical protein [Paraburkholderia jirisanensis]